MTEKSQKIFSFDTETNGLWGEAFAIAAVVYEEGHFTKSFTAYLGPEGVTDEWVRTNVFPKLNDLPKTHDSYESMLSAFADFYNTNRLHADIITHIGVPVESKILIDMHRLGLIGDWDGPFPLFDVASILKAIGEDPTSVDQYNNRNNLLIGQELVAGLSTHHPLYDAVATTLAYIDLMNKQIFRINPN